MNRILVLLFILSRSVFAQAQIITTIAGTGTASYTGDGGAATAATFSEPTTVTADTAGNLYVCDWMNNAVRKITPGGTITTVAGTGTGGFFGDGGQATAAYLNHPHGVVFDHAGNMIIADEFNDRLRKVTPAGIISTIAGSTGGYGGDGGPATAAHINQPQAIAIDTAGNIYISDAINYRVRKIDLAGVITTIAGTGVSGYTGDGGPGTAAELQVMGSLAIDSAGNIFICDYLNSVIRKLTPSGTITTVIGTGGTAGFGGDGGPASAALLRLPSNASFDRHGNLYIADQQNYRIRMVNTSGIISTVAGTGTAGYGGDGGPATLAKFNSNVGMFATTTGDLYVCDADNNRVRKITCMTTPYVSAVSGPDTVCTSSNITLTNAITGGTWAATNAHGSISSAGIVTGATPGLDTFYYTLSGTCGSTSRSKVVYVAHCPTLTVSGSISNRDDIILYPNPARNTLHIDNIPSATTYTICNMVGAIVSNGALQQGENEIGIAQLPKGIYLIKVNNTDVRKFVKI